ncbi:MAG: helix-turn-helix domain-containing protein [Gammaproteobacteria bacterium]
MGVNDKGTITGIHTDHVQQIKNDFMTCVNNPQKVSPPCYISINEFEIDKKNILHIYIPESSQVHRCNGKIYDRNEDGDLNITDNTTLVSALYLRKQQTYSENMVYPYAELADLRIDVL